MPQRAKQKPSSKHASRDAVTARLPTFIFPPRVKLNNIRFSRQQEKGGEGGEPAGAIVVRAAPEGATGGRETFANCRAASVGRCCLRSCCPCLVRGLGAGFGSTRLLGVGVAATSVRMVRFPPTLILQSSAPRISSDSFPVDQ